MVLRMETAWPDWNAYANGANTPQENISGDRSGASQDALGLSSLRGDTSTGKAQGSSGTSPDEKVKPGYKSSPAECRTCRERKYKDGSDEGNVSFKAAAHVSPEAAGAAVRGHEGEHVANAYRKAALGGGRVLRASVSIHTAVCPECGRTYVSGGTTSTAIAYPKDASSVTSERKPGEENFNS